MPKLTEEKIAELRALCEKAAFIAAARTALPDLLLDLEEARRERDQYSLMFQNSDQHTKRLRQAYTDAISGRKVYCHLCHQFFEGHPDGHGLGECVPVCGGCFINATKKDDELCDSCKRAESAERALAEARQGWMQERVCKWATKCFGVEQMTDPKVRALRLVEEAIEFAQSVGADPEKLHKLTEYVYSREPGKPFQELGGVAVTALAAAASIGAEFSEALRVEVERVEAKSVEHFAARNQAKVDLGFGPSALPAPPEPTTEEQQ